MGSYTRFEAIKVALHDSVLHADQLLSIKNVTLCDALSLAAYQNAASLTLTMELTVYTAAENKNEVWTARYV